MIPELGTELLQWLKMHCYGHPPTNKLKSLLY